MKTPWYKNKWVILFAVLFSNLPVVINMTLLHVAVPTLTTALQATGTEVLWIIDIYALMMAGLLVPMGTLADRIGAKKLLLAGLGIFLMTSVIASLATSPLMLIIARGAMALGGAMLLPCELAIIRSVFTDDKERSMAIGSFGTVLATGGAIGPLVGGFVLEHFSWNAVFLINVPILLLALPLAYVTCPDTPINTKGRWTMGQALILVMGLLSSIYAVKSLAKDNANQPLLFCILAVGLLLLAVFIRKQLKSDTPMLDLSLLQKSPIAVGFVIALIVSGALAGSEFTIAQELQFALGKSALEAGAAMMPMMLATAVGGPLAGLLIGRFGIRLISSGCLFAGGMALSILAKSDFHHVGLGIIATLALLGLSLSIGLTASSIAIMSSAPPEKAGSAGAIEGVGFELGMGLGTTIFGILLSVSYFRAIELPAEMKELVPTQALQSIGDTLIASKGLSEEQSAILIQAGKTAFINAHSTVLFSASVLVVIAGLLVAWAYRNEEPNIERTHS